ncbi:hypothetical protein CPB83DRAFT_852532 [Crepidotus variabilis]|uniref:F-box domain-containing protein n=1 Tax=Crepidotus variabilis TaxID=179855 RepID=A0A9P6EGV2_9AGAR|nr:hypothetical protein CPB83DRAFT_852532 [Crepidotus variabilis]
MNPVHSLPPELAVYLFSLVCQAAKFRRDVIDYTHPLQLGAICSSWRQLAWSTPTLWSYIYIKVSPKNAEVQAELLKDWLSRSGTVLLTVVFRLVDEGQGRGVLQRINWTDFSDHAVYLFAEKLLFIIAGECTRWQSLEVDVVSSGCTDILNDTWRRIPHLQYLRIRATEQGPDNLHFYEQAPNLAFLFLEARETLLFGLRHWSSDCWKSVTTILLDNYATYDMAAGMLIACHQTLRHFHLQSLDTQNLQTPLEVAARRADFPHLETLVLEGAAHDNPETLFPVFLSMPKLRKFEIAITGGSELNGVQNFLAHSDITLEVFRIRLFGADQGDAEEKGEAMIKLLRPHFATLHDLALLIPLLNEGSYRFIKVFHRLLNRNNYDSISPFNMCESPLPKLSFYEFSRGSFGELREFDKPWLPLVPVLEMVQSRWKKPIDPRHNQLSKLSLPGRYQDWVVDYLQKEINEGLLVNFVKVTHIPRSMEWYFED